MKVIHRSRSLKAPFSGSVVTIGNFDGVHLGHRELINRLLEMGQRYQLPTVVFTFDPHPAEVLAPDSDFARLFDQGDLVEQLAEIGVDYLVVEPFTEDFAQVSATQFIQQWICAPLRPKGLLVGHDFAFGKGREGSTKVLKELAMTKGYELVQVPAFGFDGEVVSSSRIRLAVRDGNMVLAKTLLGRPYYVKGKVEVGARRGKKLGFPTANLKPSGKTLPHLGVYCSTAQVGGDLYPAVTNVGVNPTFTSGSEHCPISVETHIFDNSLDLYNQEIRVHFFKFLRKERKFSSVEELRTQVELDIQQAREYFKSNEMGRDSGISSQ